MTEGRAHSHWERPVSGSLLRHNGILLAAGPGLRCSADAIPLRCHDAPAPGGLPETIILDVKKLFLDAPVAPQQPQGLLRLGITLNRFHCSYRGRSQLGQPFIATQGNRVMPHSFPPPLGEGIFVQNAIALSLRPIS